MRMAQTVTAKILLSAAKRISTPARTLIAINENGLTTRDAVKNDKRSDKCYDKDGKTTKSAALKDWFVSFHFALSNAHTPKTRPTKAFGLAFSQILGLTTRHRIDNPPTGNNAKPPVLVLSVRLVATRVLCTYLFPKTKQIFASYRI